ncbi:toxin co-regulated pilus biosynthesis Q family protein [Burkholderia cenocepacia]|nr:toxin co-regulated pilus biosynthesis Q family protein [Burkholderia cenocepacia]
MLALAPAAGHAALVVENGSQPAATDTPARQQAVIVPATPDQPALTATPAAAPTPATGHAKASEPQVVIQPLDQYELQAGQSIQTQMQQWASRAGWTLSWNSPDDWIVPGAKSYGPDFQAAAEAAFNQLGANGADIRVDIYVGNRSIVVNQTGASE